MARLAVKKNKKKQLFKDPQLLAQSSSFGEVVARSDQEEPLVL